MTRTRSKKPRRNRLPTAFTLPPDVIAALRVLAREDLRSPSNLVERLIRDEQQRRAAA